MKSIAVIPPRLIHRDSIALGRLVTNPKTPDDDYLDSILGQNLPDVRKRISTNHNFTEILQHTSGTKVHIALTQLISGDYGSRSEAYSCVNASRSETQQLLNSSAFFKEICEEKEIRMWLEGAIGAGLEVYMAVGFEIVVDAEISYSKQKILGRGIEITVPVTAIIASAAGLPIPIGDILDVGVGLVKTNDHSACTVFKASGEMIYAICYRKVNFGWFSSKSIDRTTLQKSRWKIAWAVRGEQKVEELKDVIDAQLSSDEEESKVALEKELGCDVLEFDALGLYIIS